MARLLPNSSDEEEEDEDMSPSPRALKGKQRARSRNDSEEEAEEDEVDDDDEQPQSKKPRTNGLDAVELGSDVGEAEEEPAPESLKRTVPRDLKDGFEQGAIVRILCHNFMTYDHVEFYPGPRLNMIIGPNGAGKSTIVSAIALGLAYHPKELGRARSISEFVKRDLHVHEAWIEIELKRINGRNPVLRRNINKSNNQSTFYLNGSEATMQTIQQIVADNNIQVDNLCCYLPQEKVYDFAKMDAPGLLKATQKSCGDRRLTDWHVKLTADKRKLMQLTSAIAVEEELLSREEDNNRVNERDVRRYEARKKVEDDLNLRRVQLPYAQYRGLREKWENQKALKSEALIALREMEAHHKPFMEKRDSKKEIWSKLKRELNTLKASNDRLSGDQINSQKRLDRLQRDMEKIQEEYEEIDAKEKQRKNGITKTQRDIANLEKALEEGTTLQSSNTMNAPLAAVGDQIREAMTRRSEIQDEQGPVEQERASLSRRLQDLHDQMRKIDDVDHQRLLMLQNSEPQTAELWKWTQKARANSRLKGKVLPPVRLACQAKQQEHSRILDGLISKNDARTILCAEYDDYQLISNAKSDQRGRETKFSNTSVASFNMSENHLKPIKDFEHPLSPEELERAGFDCWASDLISGPVEVLNWIFQEANLHQIPVSFSGQATNEELFMTSSSRIRKYVAQGNVYTFGFSNYGSRLPYTSSRPIAEMTSTFTNLPEDFETNRQRAKDRIEQLTEQVNQTENTLKQMRKREKDVSDEIKELEERKQTITAEKKRLEQAQNELRRKRTELVAKKQSLAKAQARPSGDQMRAAMQSKLREKSGTLWKAATAMCEIATGKQFEVLQEISVTSVRSMQAEANFESMKTDVNDADKDIARLTELAKSADAKLKKFKEKAQARLNKADSVLQKQSPEVQKRYEEDRAAHANQLPTVQEIEEATAELEATLAGLAQVSETVVRQFEARAAKIQEVKEKVDKYKRRQFEMQGKITSLSTKYEKTLGMLVERISDKFEEAFRKMGLQGEVKIVRHDDYDKWGIQIMVAFRDGDNLVPLTGSRQSGGERSLSTILYFMSLSTISNTPFSLVDEINQGMDARNERAVLAQLVHNICENDASQYFLITPKLLPNLTYHEQMKVLCIQNGDWLPDKLDLKSWLNKARRNKLARLL